MDWLIIALVSQFIIGSAALFDKFLLKRKFFDAWVYTFWLGIFEFAVVVIAPFVWTPLPFKIIALALLTGAIFILANFSFYKALAGDEASETLPMVGSLSPFFTLVIGLFFLKSSLDLGEAIGFVLLISAAFFLFWADNKKLRQRIILLTTMSAFLGGMYNVFAKLILSGRPFLIAFVWIKIGGALTVVFLLLFRSLRRRVLQEGAKTEVKNKFFYFLNRSYAGLGSIIFVYAISLAHPALVDATKSLQYIIIFLGGWLLLHERFRGKTLVLKIAAVILVILGLIILASVEYARTLPVEMNRRIDWGVSFSEKFSRELGLNWQANFDAILSELHPREVRLIAYWDEIERKAGQYDFSDLDWQVKMAGESGASVILAIGMKVPRWPECFLPVWTLPLNAESREAALHDYLKILVSHYKDNVAVSMWQVENEPHLLFGQCPNRGAHFVEKEIALVKSIDSSRPVLITDGGEFGLWYKAVEEGDIFGTTMYRRVYPRFIGSLFGTVDYHIDPGYFLLKTKVARYLSREPTKKFLVSELQAEPWGNVEIPQLSYEEQVSLFSPDYFKGTIEYARRAGFDEYYLWGAEWWYEMKTKYNNSTYWDYAKEIIAANH